MVNNLAREPSARLLKHVVRCYLRLSDNARYRNRNYVYMYINKFSIFKSSRGVATMFTRSTQRSDVHEHTEGG